MATTHEEETEARKYARQLFTPREEKITALIETETPEATGLFKENN